MILDLSTTPFAEGEVDLAPLVARAKILSARGWVAVGLSPLAAGRMDAELDALLPVWPDAIFLPGCADGRDVQHCAAKLAVREAWAGRPAGVTGIIAAPGPSGFAAPRGFAAASDRLIALALDRSGLELALGAVPGLLDVGGEAATIATMRGLLLLGARAAAVAAYDGLSEAQDEDFIDDCRLSRRLGFDSRIGRDAAQVAAIAAVFARP